MASDLLAFTFIAPAAAGPKWSVLWTNRSHGRDWRSTRSVQDAYKAQVVYAIKAAGGGRGVPAFITADITYRWVYADRHRRDFGGLYSAAKYLDDAMVDAGLLSDDSVNQITSAHLEFEARREADPHILVTLVGPVADRPHPPKIPAALRRPAVVAAPVPARVALGFAMTAPAPAPSRAQRRALTRSAPK